MVKQFVPIPINQNFKKLEYTQFRCFSRRWYRIKEARRHYRPQQVYIIVIHHSKKKKIIEKHGLTLNIV
jgi:hypothetical protein